MADFSHDLIKATERVRSFAVVTLGALTFFLVAAGFNELKTYRYIGSGVTATNTITVSGEGEVFAVPDTATFSASVLETAKDVQGAQAAATKKANNIVDYLKAQGIDEKDMQTTDYNVSPQYEYGRALCTATYCPPGKQILVGYQVSQTLTVKVRKTAQAGALLAGVGSRGASSVSGLSFTVADQEKLNASARDKAIQNAKDKASVLAKSLGVSLVRIVGFSEAGNRPIYYAKDVAMSSSMGMGAAAPEPAIPTGQNKITSNVSVVYEVQ